MLPKFILKNIFSRAKASFNIGNFYEPSGKLEYEKVTRELLSRYVSSNVF